MWFSIAWFGYASLRQPHWGKSLKNRRYCPYDCLAEKISRLTELTLGQEAELGPAWGKQLANQCDWSGHRGTGQEMRSQRKIFTSSNPFSQNGMVEKQFILFKNPFMMLIEKSLVLFLKIHQMKKIRRYSLLSTFSAVSLNGDHFPAC